MMNLSKQMIHNFNILLFPFILTAPPRSDRGGGFGDRDRDRGGFGDRDRDRGGFGDRDRGGFGDRDRGGFGDRDRDRGGFGDRDRGEPLV